MSTAAIQVKIDAIENQAVPYGNTKEMVAEVFTDLNTEKQDEPGVRNIINTEKFVTFSGSSNITTNTLETTSNFSQHGKIVRLDNGVNNINVTLEQTSNATFLAKYLKLGAGSVTFVAGSGVTLVQLDYTNVMNGAVGSSAELTRNGNVYYLRIYNA